MYAITQFLLFKTTCCTIHYRYIAFETLQTFYRVYTEHNKLLLVNRFRTSVNYIRFLTERFFVFWICKTAANLRTFSRLLDVLSFEKLNWTNILFTLFAELKQQKLRVCLCLCSCAVFHGQGVFWVCLFSPSHLFRCATVSPSQSTIIKFNTIIQERLDSFRIKLYNIQLYTQ